MPEKLKIETLLNELKQIRADLRKISALVESRLIGVEKPSEQEMKAIKEFELRKKKKELKLIPLSKVK